MTDNEMFEQDQASVEVEVGASGSAAGTWAATVSFIAFLAFLFLLIFLAHNHWHF
jgi:hypothetical protein